MRPLLPIALCALVPAVSHAQASFTAIDLLSGGATNSATGISADGKTVVGMSGSAGGNRAYRWTSAGGTQALGMNAEDPSSYGAAVSSNGSVIVGTTQSGTLGLRRASVWTGTGTPLDLGSFASGAAEAAGVSSDGSVVVGYSHSSSGYRAFRWTSDGGMQNLGIQSGFLTSYASGVSADGSTVVGYNSGQSSDRAFRWTSGGGMQSVGVLSGGTSSYATGISGDGSTIFGYGGSLSGTRAFRWTSGGGMTDLGVLSGGTASFANGASADGSLIVGYSQSASGNSAFLWQQGVGMMDLQSVLTNAGLGSSLSGWTLTSATGVTSVNGKTYITGTGTFNGQDRAFIAAVPEPSTLTGLALFVGACLRRRRAKTSA